MKTPFFFVAFIFALIVGSLVETGHFGGAAILALLAIIAALHGVGSEIRDTLLEIKK